MGILDIQMHSDEELPNYCCNFAKALTAANSKTKPLGTFRMELFDICGARSIPKAPFALLKLWPNLRLTFDTVSW